MAHLTTAPLTVCKDLNSSECDAVVLVLDSISQLPKPLEIFSTTLQYQNEIVSKFCSGVHVLRCDQLHHKRLVVSFTGALDRDYDDVRRVAEAAKDGMCRAIEIGSTKPLLVLAPLDAEEKVKAPWIHPKSLCLTALLGALHSIYVPLEVREFAEISASTEAETPVKKSKVQSLYWFADTFTNVDHDGLVHIAWCLEEGRRVARDIGGSDPERMCASRVVEYLKKELNDPSVILHSDPVDPKAYPLAAVVDRGSNDRHRGYIVHMDYTGHNEGVCDPLDLFLIGKGIIYDTGGSDLKVGGIMATMHRDKCGAAAVAGFFKTASLLKPKAINLHGSLALIRNSIGSNAYVSDEIITSRAGVRVRVNNTDAEGRMVMTDLLCEAKEKAVNLSRPHLMTFATLTGHVVLTYGNNYTGVMCNGPARQSKADYMFQEAGALVGEMHEVSTIRREDYEAHDAREEYADLINAMRSVGGKRSRGHQSPPAFMIRASGLDKHMLNCGKPLPYTHFDIAGSQGPCPGIPTAAPLLTLASRFLLADYWGESINNTVWNRGHSK